MNPTDAMTPSTHPLLGNLHDSDEREDTVDARHEGFLGTLQGSVDTAAGADGRVLTAAATISFP